MGDGSQALAQADVVPVETETGETRGCSTVDLRRISSMYDHQHSPPPIRERQQERLSREMRQQPRVESATEISVGHPTAHATVAELPGVSILGQASIIGRSRQEAADVGTRYVRQSFLEPEGRDQTSSDSGQYSFPRRRGEDGSSQGPPPGTRHNNQDDATKLPAMATKIPFLADVGKAVYRKVPHPTPPAPETRPVNVGIVNIYARTHLLPLHHHLTLPPHHIRSHEIPHSTRASPPHTRHPVTTTMSTRPAFYFNHLTLPTCSCW